MTKRTWSIPGLVAALVAAAGTPHARTEQQAPSREEVARLQFENGRGHMRRATTKRA